MQGNGRKVKRLILTDVLLETLKILAIVFVLMIIIEYAELRTQRRMSSWMTRGLWRQYILSSFLGATPGCIGAFASISFYVHGFLSLGAVTATMIATSGDEAFVMLAKFPEVALGLFGLLFVLGIVTGFLTDMVAGKFRIERCKECVIEEHLEDLKRVRMRHFFREHVVKHIVKQHIPRLFLWIFFTLLAIQLALTHTDLKAMLSGLPVPVLIISAAVVGIIPGSGPHLPFVFLFADGLIPFSVLLTSSIAQDGHGLLPMLSYTVRDSLIVKAFNTAYAVVTGLLVATLLGW